MTTERVEPREIVQELRDSYLDYAMSVIVSRALPDVRDGLKPVQRRILYAMHDMGFRPNSAYRKSARLVGEVLGKYHPHGDSPVYEAMVRMAQEFSMRYPLIDGQGNFGSVDRDPPAAMRYTEARLAAIAEEMLANIEQNTVDFAPNFDGSLQEPSVLPARLPNLLVNGSEGIAVGMATSIPPHNLTEICNAIEHLIDYPDATLDDIIKLVPAPDFPTGATLYVGDGGRDILKAYADGHGRVVLQAKARIEEPSKGSRRQIVISQLPYQVNKAALVQRIAELAKDKKIEGIAEVRDESDREGLRVVVELRREAQPEQVLNSLYKHTAMQASVFINMLALVDGQPRVIPLMEALRLYRDFRVTVVRRRSEFELKRARDRAHILEGLKKALDFLDQVIATIRSAASAEEARGQLMERFALSQIQAQAILDMQLRRLAALERQHILDEYQEVLKTIATLEDLLAHPEKVLAVVKEETAALKKEHGDARRTEIREETVGEWSPEETVQHRAMVIILSQRNYIKRVAADLYRSQRRGGKGILGVSTTSEDEILRLLVADTHDFVILLSSRGRLFARKVYELPEDRTRTARGIPLVNMLPLDEGERITAILAVPSFREDRFLALVTRRGMVKRIILSAFASLRSRGMMAMRLNPKDEVVASQVLTEEDDLIIVTRLGSSQTFGSGEIRTRSRAAGGIRGIRLDEDDEVVATASGQGSHLLTISERGFGKLTPVAAYSRHHRGGKGIRTLKVTPKTGNVATAIVVDPSRELMSISAAGQAIRVAMEEIRVQSRNTQGVMIIRDLPEDDKIVAVAPLEQAFGSKASPDGKARS